MQIQPLFYKLFGDPVTHSLSPKIHSFFASQFKMCLSYEKQQVCVKGLVDALAHFREQGGQGANLTLPLKEAAYALCQHTTLAAKQGKAVNTLYWDKNNDLWGDNTDGVGLLRDLQTHYGHLKDKTLLILGAGGAAAGIIPALLKEFPHSIYIANRTFSRAQDLVNKLNHPNVHALSMNALQTSVNDLYFDIIINATSASLYDEFIPLAPWVIKNRFVYDLVYNLEKPTVFVQFAKEQGAKAAYDGLGMLIEQAAESFYLWHQKRPDTHAIHLFFRPT